MAATRLTSKWHSWVITTKVDIRYFVKIHLEQCRPTAELLETVIRCWCILAYRYIYINNGNQTLQCETSGLVINRSNWRHWSSSHKVVQWCAMLCCMLVLTFARVSTKQVAKASRLKTSSVSTACWALQLHIQSSPAIGLHTSSNAIPTVTSTQYQVQGTVLNSDD